MRKIHSAVACAAALTLVLQGWSAQVAAAASSTDKLQTVIMHHGALELNQGESQYTGIYIVQFTGPITDAQKRQLQRVGAEVGDYLPDYAFLVRMDSAAASEVVRLPFIGAVVPYELEQKLGEGLAEATGKVTVRINTFGLDADRLSAALVRAGAVLVSQAPGALTVTVDRAGLRTLAGSPDVVHVEQVQPLVMFDDKATPVMGANRAWNLGLNGQGQVVAVTDTGLDTAHPDFEGQVQAVFALGKPGDHSDQEGHGTHVAGSIVGTGAASNGRIRGSVPGAKLVFQAIADRQGGLTGIPRDLTDLFTQARDAGARIHSNSWGTPATAGGTVYSGQSAQVDRFMWDNPEYTILFAAGNDGDYDRNGKPNYGTVSAPGTAKNAITVGAAQNASDNRNQVTDPSQMAGFSSRGPTSDDRVKPDVVAPGAWIAAPRSSTAPDSKFWATHENERYGYMGGTSMATPLTAGAVAILRQYYQQQLDLTPRSSLLKATLINGAAPMGQGVSWQDTGWGRVDLNRIFTRPLRYVNESRGLQTGEQASYTVTARTGQPLKATLVWTDFPASPAAGKTLVNDLDLVVTGPNGLVLGNHMLRPGADRINNVEMVEIAAPAAGTYTVTVKGHNIPQGPQRFSLVISGDLAGGWVGPARSAQ